MHDPTIYSVIWAAVLAFFVTFFTAFPVIGYLRRKKYGQQIRDDGPQRHLTKAGTPTMGGVVILAGVVAGSGLAWVIEPEIFRFGALLVGLIVAFAAIGSIDDWGKIKRGRSLGLRAREKLILQFLAAALFVLALVLLCDHRTTVGVPGLGLVDLHGWYWPVAIIFIAGMSNAVNLTDGLDGLAAGTTVSASLALAVLAWLAAPIGIFTAYIGISSTGNLLAVAMVMVCLAASCLAFLWFNHFPAKVFMGDTGSLAIGAGLAGAALILRQEVMLLLIGLIFVIEAGSVIIQVISFKTTGKRVFRMSPFHHHLELSGWSETKIVHSAWGLGIAVAALAIWLFTQTGYIRSNW